jgi:TonB family protein
MTRQPASALFVLFTGVFLASAQDAPKKVTRAEALSAAASKVQPDFPPAARQLKIEGTVELEAVIAESGAVEKVNIVSGNPVLTRPASDALRKWKFHPFMAEGKPAKVLAPVTFTFKL